MMSVKDIESLKGIGKKTADALKDAGFANLEDIGDASIEKLIGVPGLGEKKAEEIKEQARKRLQKQAREQEKTSETIREFKPYREDKDTVESQKTKTTASVIRKPIFTKMAAVFIILVFAIGGVIGYSVSHWVFTQETDQLQDQIDQLNTEITNVSGNGNNTTQIQDILAQIDALEEQLSNYSVDNGNATGNATDQIQDILIQIQALENQLASLNTSSTNARYRYCDSTLPDLYDDVHGAIVGIHAYVVQYIWGSPLYSEIGGSGFIYNFTGQQVVVTNYHVVEDTVNITITFSDGSSYPATVLGADPYADLAILSIESQNTTFETLTMVSSSTLEVGDPVIAIGNPFGLEGSMTTGIVSQLQRTITESLAGNYAIANIIQVSTPINPGNSGGPLLNYNGEVIGITTAIIEDSQGLGFAIPSSTILKEIESLITTGSYNQHAWLGVTGTDMNYELSQVLGINVSYGWLIASVVHDGPADTAGIQGGNKQISIKSSYTIIGGDLIIALDGQKIISGDNLISYLEAYTTPGQTIDVTIIRDKQEMTIPVELGTRPLPN